MNTFEIKLQIIFSLLGHAIHVLQHIHPCLAIINFNLVHYAIFTDEE
jgi:hypothetical protein